MNRHSGFDPDSHVLAANTEANEYAYIELRLKAVLPIDREMHYSGT